METLAPLSQSKRIDLVDSLRGFAIFGILMVNMLTLAIFSFQISFSKFWLSKYRFGPLEWLWRTLTYGKVQAFKL